MSAESRRIELFRALDAAVSALRTDRTRTRAALVALTIAMAIVVCVTAIVERGRAATIRALERAGLSNLYLIDRGAAAPRGTGVPGLTAADAERLRRLTRARSTVLVRVERRNLLVRGRATSVPVYAIAGPSRAVFAMRRRSGRMLGDLDVERRSRYAVLGSDLSRNLPAAGVGSVLAVGAGGYEVVGHLEDCESESAAVGEIPALDWNRAVVVPLGAEPSAAAEPEARYPVDVAVLSFSGPSEALAAMRVARSLDPARYADGPVRLASPAQTLRQYRQARRTFDRLLWLVALLTGASALFGVSNLLSASVAARTREIGIRRAVGARARDIVLQFRMEGLLLGLLGGGAGLLAGGAISFAAMDRSAGAGVVSVASFATLAALCVALGVLTGIRPARRAARIDPAAALREG